jgi:hypothetical protein
MDEFVLLLQEKVFSVAYSTMIQEVEIECPYCGANYVTTVDTSEGSHSTIEDCTVCCRPIELRIVCSPGAVEEVHIARA